ncbi:MAG: biotin synthase BioB [Desulfovibrio sp.]|jgi:biotin synthase|nr:biotin synthase BioB [Desulfovibrio sp.]
MPKSRVTKKEAFKLVSLPLPRLLADAGRLRESVFGGKVQLCAIINARGGNCAMDCSFCSQSRHNKANVDVFELLPSDTLRERILALSRLPVAKIGLVASGELLSGKEFDRLCKVARTLPAEILPRICMSLGRLEEVQLAELAAIGIRRYHHNLETSESHYPRICTTQTWRQRRDTILRTMRAGMQACSGGLFGLGESWEQRIEFAFSLRELDVRYIPLNFLNPHPNTPLASQPPLSAEEALRIIAVFRHILPEATLRICGGRPLVLGERQREMFAAGANALMTGNYLTTSGYSVENDLVLLASLGLEPVVSESF